MSEDKKNQIPIEESADETEEVKAEEAESEEAAAEEAKAAQQAPQVKF
jgi:hypothetical protein